MSSYILTYSRVYLLPNLVYRQILSRWSLLSTTISHPFHKRYLTKRRYITMFAWITCHWKYERLSKQFLCLNYVWTLCQRVTNKITTVIAYSYLSLHVHGFCRLAGLQQFIYQHRLFESRGGGSFMFAFTANDLQQAQHFPLLPTSRSQCCDVKITIKRNFLFWIMTISSLFFFFSSGVSLFLVCLPILPLFLFLFYIHFLSFLLF